MDQFLLSPHNWDMILRLLLATVLGGAVGIERGSGDRPAGSGSEPIYLSVPVRHL